MTTTEMKLSEIRANPNNPRLIKDEKFAKLVESIRTFPEMLKLRPIVVNDDNIVLGGNMRLKACKEAGLKTVPVIKASEFTEEQQREFIIKDNVGFGEWDWEMLGNGWDAEKLEEWAVEIPGWATGHEVNNMTDDDIDITETFDAIGKAKNLLRVVLIFDNEDAAGEFMASRLPDIKYKRNGNGMTGTTWQVNLSDTYGE